MTRAPSAFRHSAEKGSPKRTGAQYEASLDGGCRVYFEGARVKDLFGDPRTAAAVAAVSAGYERYYPRPQR